MHSRCLVKKNCEAAQRPNSAARATNRNNIKETTHRACGSLARLGWNELLGAASM